MPRKPKPVMQSSISFTGFSLVVNGGRVTGGSIDYRREVLPDGTVREKGRPPGVGPNPSISELAGYALGAFFNKTGKPKGKRAIK